MLLLTSRLISTFAGQGTLRLRSLGHSACEGAQYKAIRADVPSAMFGKATILRLRPEGQLISRS